MIITLLRKPLEGSVAENTLQHGCGAINIDATRVTTTDNLNGGAYAENPTERGGEYEQPSGRWPANFMLTHLDGCELKGTKKVKEGKNNSDLGGTDRKVGLYKDGLKKRAEDHYQGEETVADWDCAEGCPIKILDEQSGISKSTGGRIGNKQGIYSNQGGGGWSTDHTKGDAGFGDTGGASRFFMQFKKGDDQ
jgi:hypothetical protein